MLLGKRIKNVKTARHYIYTYSLKSSTIHLYVLIVVAIFIQTLHDITYQSNTFFITLATFSFTKDTNAHHTLFVFLIFLVLKFHFLQPIYCLHLFFSCFINKFIPHRLKSVTHTPISLHVKYSSLYFSFLFFRVEFFIIFISHSSCSNCKIVLLLYGFHI